jgi:hypothetical protein
MEFRKKRNLAIAVAAGILVAAAALVLALPRARTALRLVGGFSPLEVDARVYFEAGAEDMARAVAEALPAAMARVETCQAGPFEDPFRVYVCASHEGFTRRIGQPVNSPVRGITFLRDIWISPMAFSFHGEDTHRETLTHELSHLHLGQKLGWWRRTKGVPAWFQEGLADWVADTGDVQISRREAREALKRGRHFVPDATGHLPFPKGAGDYGLPWPLFHIQSRMFVEYLRARNEEAFSAFVASVVEGDEFESAFSENYLVDLPDVWNDFLQSSRAATPSS